MGDSEAIEVGKIVAEKLRVEDGDTVVVTIPALTSWSQRTAFQKAMTEKYVEIGKRVIVVVVTDGVSVDLLKAEKVDEIDGRLDALEGALHLAGIDV